MPVLYGEHEPLIADAVCIVCGSSQNPVMDHCHAHGWVRGVLCRSCNFAMRHVDWRSRPGNGALSAWTTWDALVAHAARCIDCPPITVDDLETPDAVTVCVKLTDAEKAIVDRLARRDGIIHLDGKPNRSAWVRRMIHQADETDRGEG